MEDLAAGAGEVESATLSPLLLLVVQCLVISFSFSARCNISKYSLGFMFSLPIGLNPDSFFLAG